MTWWTSLYFQDLMTTTDIFLSLDSFHSLVMLVQLGVMLLVGMTLVLMCTSSWFYHTAPEWVTLEILWTMVPAFILLYLGIPSLELLYHHESLFVSPSLMVKVTGHQWYWEYAIPELKVNFDSFTNMNPFLHLSDVSARMVLPVSTNIQVLVTSHDVIHSFAIPSLAVKVDANPGRLNSSCITPVIPGLYVGQCSELCGALHSAMSIMAEVVGVEQFMGWIGGEFDHSSEWADTMDPECDKDITYCRAYPKVNSNPVVNSNPNVRTNCFCCKQPFPAVMVYDADDTSSWMPGNWGENQWFTFTVVVIAANLVLDPLCAYIIINDWLEAMVDSMAI